MSQTPHGTVLRVVSAMVITREALDVSEFDVVIRGGTVVDGTGLPGYRADVGIRDGLIATIGRVTSKGATEIDAEGHAVTPGFIDGHTHMDAQLFWDPSGSSSSWNGVTSVVMGNCGFTLAPARADARELVVRNLERAEDISADALAQGIDWTWEDFAGYFDAVDGRPKAINYAGYVGHSALRTWAMGERAFSEQATDDDLQAMRAELRSALHAGAIGMSSSRSYTHLTSDDRPVASRVGAWDEVVALAAVLAEFDGDRLFQLSVEAEVQSTDPAVRAAALARLGGIALDFRVPVTFGILSPVSDSHRWRGLLGLIDETAAAGGRMFGQTLAREMTIVLGFPSRLPFDGLPSWASIRSLSQSDQLAALLDPTRRARLVAEASEATYHFNAGGPVRAPDYEHIRVVLDPIGPNPTLVEIARQRGTDPLNALIDLSIETGLEQLFSQSVANRNEDEVLAMMRHPRTVMTFSDSGAHVGNAMESSIQTYLLAYWVRRREAFTFEEAVRMITLAPARAWGFADRGLIREGLVADLNVLDPQRIAPMPLEYRRDLPAGGGRLVQRSTGIRATLVAGIETLHDGAATGAFPGRLLRRTTPTTHGTHATHSARRPTEVR